MIGGLRTSPCIARWPGMRRPCGAVASEYSRRFGGMVCRACGVRAAAVEWRELRANDYGAPTIRRRLFIIARCDGEPVRWPASTHGRGMGLLPYRTAAECIDWGIPCPSIFERARPLAEATLRRIAHGIWRFVINNPDPFIIQVARGTASAGAPFIVKPGHSYGHHVMRGQAADAPLQTVTTEKAFAVATPFLTKFQQNSIGQELDEPVDTVMAGAPRFGLVAPTLVETGYGEREGQAPRAPGLDKPLRTVVAGGGKHALVAAFLAKHFGGPRPQAGAPLTAPLPTTLTRGAQTQLVTSNLIKLYGTSDAASVGEPMPTVTATGQHIGEVRAFLQAYYGSDPDGQAVTEPLRTLTTKERFALVMVHGVPHYIDDIGMRMLMPRELYRAQGFPEGYIIAPKVNGKPLSKTAQIRCCGNSVCPDVARELVAANVVFAHQAELFRGYELAAAGAVTP